MAHRRAATAVWSACRRFLGVVLASLLVALSLAVGPFAPLGLGPPSAKVYATSGYSNRQGIDSCPIPSDSLLHSEWFGTPFVFWGYYLGGAYALYLGCDPWSSSKLTTAGGIGWSLLPIWDDKQAPCYGAPSQYLMSSNTTTAYNQGFAAGTSAETAMTAAGFGSVDQVWLDLESYDTGNSSCKAAVLAYVNGWSTSLGPDSGVYGSASGSAVDSWSTIAHPPAEVAIAAWDSSINTVWNIGSVSNGHWSGDQRVHQYRHHKLAAGTTNFYFDIDCALGWLDLGSLANELGAGSEPNEFDSITAEPICAGQAQ